MHSVSKPILMYGNNIYVIRRGGDVLGHIFIKKIVVIAWKQTDKKNKLTNKQTNQKKNW